MEPSMDLVLISILLILLLLTLILPLIKGQRQTQKKPKIITLIKCSNKDYETRREFKQGDFVGKIEGKCPKCGNRLFIVSIYATSLKQK